MAAGISVIMEVARQASSFDFANPPDGANLDTWTIPQLKEFLRPRRVGSTNFSLCKCGTLDRQNSGVTAAEVIYPFKSCVFSRAKLYYNDPERRHRSGEERSV